VSVFITTFKHNLIAAAKAKAPITTILVGMQLQRMPTSTSA
jgi:hypothetical protein